MGTRPGEDMGLRVDLSNTSSRLSLLNSWSGEEGCGHSRVLGISNLFWAQTSLQGPSRAPEKDGPTDGQPPDPCLAAVIPPFHPSFPLSFLSSIFLLSSLPLSFLPPSLISPSIFPFFSPSLPEFHLPSSTCRQAHLVPKLRGIPI